MGCIVILASCEHHFSIRVHENLVQHPIIIYIDLPLVLCVMFNPLTASWRHNKTLITYLHIVNEISSEDKWDGNIHQLISNQFNFLKNLWCFFGETKAMASKTVCNCMKIVRNTVVNMTFQYGWEPVLIQRILISFEAILEKNSFILQSTVLSSFVLQT